MLIHINYRDVEVTFENGKPTAFWIDAGELANPEDPDETLDSLKKELEACGWPVSFVQIKRVKNGSGGWRGNII